MKGKKMVFAVILSLIVCLLVLPTCAFADEEVVIENPVTDPATGGVTPATIVEGENNFTTEPDVSGEMHTTTTDTTTTETTTTDTATTEITSTETTTSETTTTTTESTTGENVGDESDKGGSSFMVEFSYGDKSFKLDNLKGNEQFGLAEILKELGIEGIIDDAKGDADDLFSAENGENGWNVTTKKAFSSKQTMTVIVDGVEYVLKVIDDQNVSTAETLKAAIEAVKSGESPTFKLVADIAGNFEIKAGTTITIDLNGHTLTNPGVNQGATIHNYGTLTIKDSSLNKNGKLTTYCGDNSPALFNYSTGVATLESGTITRNGSAGYVIDNRGQMTIKKDVKVNGGGYGWTVICTGRYSTGTSLVIEGGEYGNAQSSVLIKNESGVLEVNDGVFEGYTLTNYGDSTINGGTFNSNNATIVNGDGKVTINGGDFTSQESGIIHFVYKGSEAEINGGTFTANKGGVIRPSGSNTTDNGGKVNVNGGTFNSTLDLYSKEQWPNLDMNVTGGSFKDKSYEQFTKGSIDVIEKDGMFFVKTVPGPANTIALTSDAPVFKYMVVEGKDQTWTKSANTDALNYVLNADAKNLVKVLIDGEEVEFEIDENGEVVISAEVLEKLDAGEYEIEFIFADGSCKTKLFVK